MSFLIQDHNCILPVYDTTFCKDEAHCHCGKCKECGLEFHIIIKKDTDKSSPLNNKMII